MQTLFAIAIINEARYMYGKTCCKLWRIVALMKLDLPKAGGFSYDCAY